MDWLKWSLAATTGAFVVAILCILLYLLVPFILTALTGVESPCLSYQPAAAPGGQANIISSMASLCLSARAVLGTLSMVLIIIVGPLLLVTNCIALLEIFHSKAQGGSKIVWAAIVWFVPCFGAIAYYFKGRKSPASG